jgi:hypothetical protein
LADPGALPSVVKYIFTSRSEAEIVRLKGKSLNPCSLLNTGAVCAIRFNPKAEEKNNNANIAVIALKKSLPDPIFDIVVNSTLPP